MKEELNFLEKQWRFTDKEICEFKNTKFDTPNILKTEHLVRIPLDRYHNEDTSMKEILIEADSQCYVVPGTRWLFMITEYDDGTNSRFWYSYRKMDSYYKFSKDWLGKWALDVEPESLTRVLEDASEEAAEELTFDLDIFTPENI